ncbi:MAG: carbon-nitrogen hydrolase, partial [Myxococcota bacterium]
MTGDRANLDDFERKLILRSLRREDFDDVVRMQLSCFPGQKPWTLAELDNHIETFPEGQLGIFIEDRLVASASSLVIQQDDFGDLHDWKTVSGNGTIENHDPDGDT